MRRLAAAPGLTNITSLALTAYSGTDAGVIALANSPYVGGLRDLTLHPERLTEVGIMAVIDSPNLSGLRTIGYSARFDVELSRAARARMYRWYRSRSG